MDPELEGAYEAKLAYCHACTATEKAQADLAKSKAPTEGARFYAELSEEASEYLAQREELGG